MNFERPAGVPPLLHILHPDAQPRVAAKAPPREVIHEKGLNAEKELVIERDEKGRITSRKTRELRRRVRSFEGGEGWEDLVPYVRPSFPSGGTWEKIMEYITHAPPITAIGCTSEEFEYVPGSDRVARVVEKKFLDITPDTPTLTTTTEFDYTSDGQVQERRVALQYYNDDTPCTYHSKVTKWEAGKPTEMVIMETLKGGSVEYERWTMEYDAHGRSIKEQNFVGQGDEEMLYESYDLIYNEQGRLIKVHINALEAGYSGTWLYDYENLPDGSSTVTRRNLNEGGREEGGERITFGKNGEKLRQESWMDIVRAMDTLWVKQG